MRRSRKCSWLGNARKTPGRRTAGDRRPNASAGGKADAAAAPDRAHPQQHCPHHRARCRCRHGKSTLLRELAAALDLKITTGPKAPPPDRKGGFALWDLGPSTETSRLPAAFEDSAERLIIAKRPSTEVAGLARALVYGRAEVVGSGELLLQVDDLPASMSKARARRVVERTGGWPLLLPYEMGAVVNEDHLATMLQNEVLDHLDATDFVLLGEVLAGRATIGSSVAGLSPLVSRRQDGTPYLAIEMVRTALDAAYGRALARRAAEPAAAEPLCRALLAQAGRPRRSCRCNRWGIMRARSTSSPLPRAIFYIYRHGQAAFEQVLAGFPLDFALRHEPLVLCFALQALKRGDVARARQLIGDHIGDGANRPFEVFGQPASYSVPFRFFRVLMLIYEDVFITDDLFEQIFRADQRIARRCRSGARLILQFAAGVLHSPPPLRRGRGCRRPGAASTTWRRRCRSSSSISICTGQ